MKLLLVSISGICCAVYIYMWYAGLQVQPWVALVWCASVFFADLEKYLESRWKTTNFVPTGVVNLSYSASYTPEAAGVINITTGVMPQPKT